MLNSRGTGYLNSDFTNQLSSYVIPTTSDEMTDIQLEERLNSLVEEFTKLLDIIERKGLQNKQWCLDGMDKINEQSVRF